MNLVRKQTKEDVPMKRKHGRTAVIISALLALMGGSAHAGYTVATRFADVIMEFIQPGKVYNLRTMRNLPYRVENHSNGEADLEVTVEVPPPHEMKNGYEPIPDASWVRVVPNKMKLR